MSEIPADAPRSDDGTYWWDGDAWQPVAGSADTADATADSGSGEIGPEALEPMADTGPEPGNEEALTEQTRPYFDMFDAGEDLSEAELDAVLDENEFVGETNG